MTSSSIKAPARGAAARKGLAKTLGSLPEWNLADLYPGIESAELKRDVEWTEAECVAFEKAYKGNLEALATGGGLVEAVRRYEKIDDVAGRLSSYAGLLHAGNAADPVLSKFYGDMQERLTAAYLHLLFFTLELNRIDDAVLDKAMADPALGHYRPWLEDIRRDKPYQLEDRVEQLFQEKSMTGYSAFNRLFDETMVHLRFKVAGKTHEHRADAQPVPEPEGAHAQGGVRGARQDLQGQPAAVHADHQYARQGQGDFRPLARLHRRGGLAASLQPRRAGGGRCAGCIRARRLSATLASLLRAESEMVRQEEAGALGPQRAAAAGRDAHHPLGRGAEHRALRLRRVLAEDGGDRRALLQGSLDRCAGAAGQIAGRVLASDRAVGAPVCDAQLPGQAARRDDACA